MRSFSLGGVGGVVQAQRLVQGLEPKVGRRGSHWGPTGVPLETSV